MFTLLRVMWNLMSQGGSLAWVLLVLAFVAVVVTLERILFFQRSRIHVGNLLLGLANHIRKGAYSEALYEASRAPGPVARMAHSVLMRHTLPRQDLKEIAKEAGQLEVPQIERNLRALYAVALLAPLVGMMGTVLGLVETFSAMQENVGFTSTKMINNGVYEALITTALGLMVAVPSYLFYLYFLGRAQSMVYSLERAGIEIVNVVYDAGEDMVVTPSKLAKNRELTASERLKTEAPTDV